MTQALFRGLHGEHRVPLKQSPLLRMADKGQAAVAQEIRGYGFPLTSAIRNRYKRRRGQDDGQREFGFHDIIATVNTTEDEERTGA